MRLTRDTLIKIARDTASQRARVSRRIICIYLTGSVLGDAPLLGGTTDIDLIIIQDGEPVQPREIVRLSDEVHLDIGYYAQAVFHQPRHLRTDPWLGPFIYQKPMVLYDTQHWFDFIQAATGAQFFQPDYILARATKLAQAARQGWMDLEFNPGDSHAGRVNRFLSILENAGNALVSLTGEGDPLSERRFMLQFPARLQELNQPNLVSGLTSLLITNQEELEKAWPGWLESWPLTYQAGSRQDGAPPELHPCRQIYYERAARALWEENPTAAVWLLMRSWTMAASSVPEDSSALSGWESACQQIGLDDENFARRLSATDRYLDQVEEALDAWGRSNGVSSLSEV